MTVVVPIPTSRSLGQLKARIADELARSDLTSQIALAIDDAITEAATHRFWFNEVRGLTFSLVAGQDYYGSPDLGAMTEIDDLWLTAGGQRRNLRVANDRDADQMSTGSPTRGEPYLWSRYGDFLRFYPVPNQSYVVTIDGSTRFLPLDNDDSSNPWTNEGERYIRALAKRELYANVIQDDARAQTQDALAGRYREELIGATYDRVASGQMACNG